MIISYLMIISYFIAEMFQQLHGKANLLRACCKFVTPI